MARMLGWSSLASVLASDSKRLTKPSSWNRSGDSALSATSRPSGCCTALYTTAIPPPPKRSTISYWPSRVPVRSFIATSEDSQGYVQERLRDHHVTPDGWRPAFRLRRPGQPAGKACSARHRRRRQEIALGHLTSNARWR